MFHTAPGIKALRRVFVLCIDAIRDGINGAAILGDPVT